VVVLCVSAVTLVAACGGVGAKGAEAITACLNGAHRQARFVDNDDQLFADEVHVASYGNKARIRVFASPDEARNNYELVEDEFEPSTLWLIDNVVVSWDEPPARDDDRTVRNCLRNT